MESDIDEMQGKMRIAGREQSFALPEFSCSCSRMTTLSYVNAAPKIDLDNPAMQLPG